MRLRDGGTDGIYGKVKSQKGKEEKRKRDEQVALISP